METFLGYEKI